MILNLSAAHREKASRAVDPDLFREGMSHVAAAVHVVTVRDGAHTAGVTATAVCAISDRPSSVLVCLHRQGQVGALLRPGLQMAVNTLRSGHAAIANVFAGKGALPMSERFQHGDWHDEQPHAPFLADSLATFFCRVCDVVEAATHLVAVGEVLDLQINADPQALIYGARRYRSLDLATGPVPVAHPPA